MTAPDHTLEPFKNHLHQRGHPYMTRKPRMVAAIALANKMARALWAMLTKQEDYRNPVAELV